MITVLLIDDDTTFCLMLKGWLQKKGFAVQEAFTSRDAFRKLKEGAFDLILTDVRLPDEDGLSLLTRIREHDDTIPVILMTGYGDVQSAVQAMKSGAFDYMTKPFLPDDMLRKMEEALNQKSKAASIGTAASKGLVADADKSTVSTTKEVISELDRNRPSYIKGSTPEAEKLYEYIRLVAPTQMSVLITGESGSGKEYIARLIHEQSNRSNAPFVAVDCGAIPKELATSEFFGHLKGSFTGALTDKTGLFVSAAGGTVFLDEIGNLSYEVQVQLLRALEERKIKPVGSNKELEIDVRIVAATNENLHRAVAEGTFREDLYHRLNELSLKALSLRDRKADIPVFAQNFLRLSNRELNRSVTGFDEEVTAAFLRYAWPGNLREMRNVVKRATLLCRGDVITEADIPTEIAHPAEPDVPLLALRNQEQEEQQIRRVLEACNRNKSEAARLLKIDRKTLYNKIKAYGIEL